MGCHHRRQQNCQRQQEQRDLLQLPGKRLRKQQRLRQQQLQQRPLPQRQQRRRQQRRLLQQRHALYPNRVNLIIQVVRV